MFIVLSTPPKTEADRLFLAKNTESIRGELLDIYLAPYRYLWTQDEDVKINYETMLGLSPMIASFFQRTFDFVAGPLYFKGTWKEV